MNLVLSCMQPETSWDLRSLHVGGILIDVVVVEVDVVVDVVVEVVVDDVVVVFVGKTGPAQIPLFPCHLHPVQNAIGPKYE